MTLSERIDQLIFKMTPSQVSYWWVTNPKAPKPNLEMMQRNNPRGYAWLMLYVSLIEEEENEKKENDSTEGDCTPKESD